MNTLICAIVLILLALVNYRLAKNIFYPAFIFCCYWAALLLTLIVLPNEFYHLSNEALSIFTIGALFFSLGSMLVYKFGRKSYPNNPQSHPTFISHRVPESYPWLKNLLLIGLVFSILTLPYFCYHIYSLVSVTNTDTSGFLHLMLLARQLRSLVTYSNGLDTFKYFIAGISFLSLISLVEFSQGRCTRWMPILYASLTLIYHFLSTARTGLIYFMLTFILLYFISKRKIKVSSLILSATFILVAFFLPAIILQNGSSAHASILENISSLFINIQIYIVGSIVGLDKAIDSPMISEYFPHMYSLRFFLSILHHLGFQVQVPELILPYVFTPYPLNIYTMYFPWFNDFSWPGVVIITFVLGVLSTISYKSALRKEPAGMIFYTTIVAGILLGTIGDFFLISLSLWIQLGFYIFLLYKAPTILKSFFKIKEKHLGHT